MLADIPAEIELHIFADNELLQQAANRLGNKLSDSFIIHHIPVSVDVIPGELNPANAHYVLDCLRSAVTAIQAGDCDAMVTGPVHKGVINQAGIPFTGHTEFLAELSDTQQVVMMLMADQLRVALATTHLPLKAVCEAITTDRLTRIIHILHKDLCTRFGIQQPRISVCGLNPHAGEGGHLGTEEIEVISPVLESLRLEGFLLNGPLPADTAFTPKWMTETDAYLAMYHDQGLPVLKYVGFGRAVNITLGLPFVRTSVDHGTALELAGSGQASPASLYAAIEAARQMSRT